MNHLMLSWKDEKAGLLNPTLAYAEIAKFPGATEGSAHERGLIIGTPPHTDTDEKSKKID